MDIENLFLSLRGFLHEAYSFMDQFNLNLSALAMVAILCLLALLYAVRQLFAWLLKIETLRSEIKGLHSKMNALNSDIKSLRISVESLREDISEQAIAKGPEQASEKSTDSTFILN